MRLLNDKRFTKESFADLGVELYRVNDEIYDQVDYIGNGKFRVTHRCGTEPYSINHTHEVFFTDNKTLVYPLDPLDYWEEEIQKNEIKSFNETTALSVSGGEFELSNVVASSDTRYKVEKKHYTGNEITIDDDEDENTSESYVMSISNDSYNTSTKYGQGQSYIPRSFTFNGLTEKTNNEFHNIGIQQSDGTYATGLTRDHIHNPSHKDYFRIYQYEACGYTKEDITDKVPVDKYMYHVKDMNTVNMGRALKRDYTMYAYTYIYFQSERTTSFYYEISPRVGYTMYVDGVAYKNVNPTNIKFSVGWHLLEVVIQFQKTNAVTGFRFSSGDFYNYIRYASGLFPDYSLTSAIINCSYDPKDMVGLADVEIKTKNPFRSIENINDVFWRINPLYPKELLKSPDTSVLRGWQYVHQRRVGAYTVNGTEIGELITDENDEHYGMYKVEVRDIVNRFNIGTIDVNCIINEGTGDLIQIDNIEIPPDDQEEHEEIIYYNVSDFIPVDNDIYKLHFYSNNKLAKISTYDINRNYINIYDNTNEENDIWEFENNDVNSKFIRIQYPAEATNIDLRTASDPDYEARYEYSSADTITFVIPDAKKTSKVCLCDKLDDDKISISGGQVTITLSEEDDISNYVGATVLYELNEDLIEPILNQIEVHDFVSSLFYRDYWFNNLIQVNPKNNLYLIDDPTQMVTYPTALGQYDCYMSPIMNTVPGEFYFLQRQGSLSKQYLDYSNVQHRPTIVITYDKNYNQTGWYSWETFVNPIDLNDVNCFTYAYWTCPENVYGIRIIGHVANGFAMRRLSSGGMNNLFDTNKWYECYLNDIEKYPSHKKVGLLTINGDTVHIDKTEATTIGQINNVQYGTYNILLKNNHSYILTFDLNQSENYDDMYFYFYRFNSENDNVATNGRGAAFTVSRNSSLNPKNRLHIHIFNNTYGADCYIRPCFGSYIKGAIHDISNIRIYDLGEYRPQSLQYQINDGDIQTMDLPFSFIEGNELIYSPERHEWRLVKPETSSSYDVNDFRAYSEEEIPPIKLNKGDRIKFLNPNITASTYFDYNKNRVLKPPTEITLSDGYKTGEHGYGYIKWDSVIGATEYRILLNDEVIANFDAEWNKVYNYDFSKELKGKLCVEAWNETGTIGRSEYYDIETVPSTMKFTSFDSNFADNRYYIDVKFNKTSQTADAYLLFYSLDGGNNNVIRYENDKSGDEVNERITIVNVSDNISFQLIPTNESGDNDYAEAIDLKPCDGFDVWTYKEGSKQLLTTFYDKFDDEELYNIKYRINEGEWQILQVEGSEKPNERIVEYLDLNPTDIMDLCLAPVRKGYANLYSKPMRVSKDLDTTLIAPKDFVGKKLQDGRIQFTWLDDYTVDSAFELYYTYSDGTSDTIKIDQDLDYGSYVYTTDNYGFINARVKMVWEFGESAYTNFIIVYNIPEVEQAPSITSKRRDEKDVNSLVISWEQYDFVSNYIVYFNVNGTQQIIETQDNSFTWKIPDDLDICTISCMVQAKFIDGSLTNISDSVGFRAVASKFTESTMVYGIAETENKVDTLIYTKGMKDYYDFIMRSTNHYNWDWKLYFKRYTPEIMTDFTLADSYWGHNVGETYPLKSTHITKDIVDDYNLHQSHYANLIFDYLVNSVFTTPTEREYLVHTQVDKATIACLGDSITAGHPNYWAETGTGMITSQYEYWLNRRLKDEYNVVNLGYGQEKLVDMIERFERDVLPVNPKYCILHGGTNDYLNIVRYSLETL